MVELDEFESLVRRYFRVATIVALINCSIDYQGRAASKAGKAWRLLIIKEDGTVLVHEGKGREPINWQPKSHIVIRRLDNRIELVAIRTKPHEELRIHIEPPIYLLVTRLSTARFILFGAEKDIIDKIANNPSIIEEGAELVSREVSTPHGRVDVVLRRRDGTLIIVEAKRSTADVDAVHQLRRYVEYYKSLGVKVEGVLASPKVTPQALKLLHEFGLRHVKVEPLSTTR